MDVWVDPVEVAGVGWLTVLITGRLKRALGWKGRRVQLVALFVAIVIAIARAFFKDPTLTGLPLVKALLVGVITGFAAVEYKNSQKPTPADIDSEEGK